MQQEIVFSPELARLLLQGPGRSGPMNPPLAVVASNNLSSTRFQVNVWRCLCPSGLSFATVYRPTSSPLSASNPTKVCP